MNRPQYQFEVHSVQITLDTEQITIGDRSIVARIYAFALQLLGSEYDRTFNENGDAK